MLYFILALGFVLRLFALESHDFWFDEALTYHFAKLDLVNLLTVVATDNNPPLYYILIHFLLKISSNEIFLRLPSFVAGVLTLAVLWKLSPTAASLFSVSPLAIYIGTEARLHSLATLFATLAYFSFLKVLRRNNPKNIALFITVSTLALYTQYYLALLLIPFMLITIFKRKKLAWINLVPLLLLTPWLIFSLLQPHNGCWCPNSLISLPATLASPAIGGIGKVTQRSFIDLPILIFLLFSITGLISIIVFFKGILKNFVPSFTYFVPLIILTIFGFFLPIFSPKGASVFTPIFFLISTQYLLNQKSRLLVTLVILLSSVSLFQITSPFFKGDNLKGIAQIISSHDQDNILHTSPATYYPEKYYLPHGNHLLLSENPLNPKMVSHIGGQKVENLPELENIWLVDSPLWVDEKTYQEKKSSVFTKYQILSKYKLNNINVYHLKLR